MAAAHQRHSAIGTRNAHATLQQLSSIRPPLHTAPCMAAQCWLNKRRKKHHNIPTYIVANKQAEQNQKATSNFNSSRPTAPCLLGFMQLLLATNPCMLGSQGGLIHADTAEYTTTTAGRGAWRGLLQVVSTVYVCALGGVAASCRAVKVHLLLGR
jgi:hypothetical protein